VSILTHSFHLDLVVKTANNQPALLERTRKRYIFKCYLHCAGIERKHSDENTHLYVYYIVIIKRKKCKKEMLREIITCTYVKAY